MLSNADIPFLTALSEHPQDKVLWQSYARWLFDHDHEDEAVFILNEWGIIRHSLLLDWPHVSMVREAAEQVSEYARDMIDVLIPMIRHPGTMAYGVWNFRKEPPPLPWAEEV